MSHLLYSSNEMYSSTELIRKSKTIFNKIISNEIDKAIILRDGKPSFMLLDFDKYEKIMAEYAILKANISTQEDTTLKTKSKKKIKKLKKEKVNNHIKIEPTGKEQTKVVAKVEEIKEIEEIPSLHIKEEIEPVKKVEIKSSHIVPPTPIYEEEIIESEESIDMLIEDENEEEVLKERTDDAVQKGIEVLDNLDFDDKFREEVEAKVRERKSREIVAQNIKDKKIQKEIEEEKEKEMSKNKKVQLKEFWA